MGDQENYEEPASSGGLFSNKKILVIIVLLIITGVILIGFFSVSKRSTNARKVYKMVKVFDRLSDQEAAKLREELSFEGFHFDTKVEGKYSTIEIPENEADNARIKMAQKGLPSGGVVGFEIFDKSGGLGVTDFDKRIQFIRAISGELSRNISRINSIENARVQIVMPEEKIFSFKKPDVTASVLVQRKRGAIITKEQIRGIMHLVAASVESLKPENVTVIDMEGNILSEKVIDFYKPGAKKQSTTQERTTESDESYLDNGVEAAGINDTEGSMQSLNERAAKTETNQTTSTSENKTAVQAVDYITLKTSIEQDITQKVNKLLAKLYPVGSTSVIVSVELKNNSTAAFPKFSKKNVVILVDSKAVKMNQPLKNTTYSVVSPIIGYVKGRDTIQLRNTSFIKVSSDEVAKKSGTPNDNKPAIAQPPVKQKDSNDKSQDKLQSKANTGNFKLPWGQNSTKINRNQYQNVQRYSYSKLEEKRAKQRALIEKQSKYFNIKIVGVIIGVVIVLIVISIIIRKRRDKDGLNNGFEASLFNSKHDDDMMENIKDELEEQEDEAMSQIKNIVEENPDKIAHVLKDWLTEERGE